MATDAVRSRRGARGRRLVGERSYHFGDRTATRILPDGGPDGDPTFGPEIGYDDWQGTRTFFRRRDGRLEGVDLVLGEIRFGSETVWRQRLAPSSTTVMLGERPPSTRVVRLALRPGVRRLEPVVFEETPGLTPPADVDATAIDDARAASLLTGLSPYPFSAEDGLIAAYTLATPEAWPHDRRPDGGERLAPDHSVSVIDDADMVASRLRAHPDLVRLREHAETRRILVTPSGQAVPLPAELAGQSAMLMTDAVNQALCGAGADHARWQGRAVAELAAELFRRHLLKRLHTDRTTS